MTGGERGSEDLMCFVHSFIQALYQRTEFLKGLTTEPRAKGCYEKRFSDAVRE